MPLMSIAIFSPTILLKLVPCSLRGHHLALQERRGGKESCRENSHGQKKGRTRGKKKSPKDCWLC